MLLIYGKGNIRIVSKRGIETIVNITEWDEEEFLYRSSVDALMLSVAECFPDRAIGVILIDIVNDGLNRLILIKETGGRIFAQNEEICVVYRMPKAVIEAGIADKVLPVEHIAGEIINDV